MSEDVVQYAQKYENKWKNRSGNDKLILHYSMLYQFIV